MTANIPAGSTLEQVASSGSSRPDPKNRTRAEIQGRSDPVAEMFRQKREAAEQAASNRRQIAQSILDVTKNSSTSDTGNATRQHDQPTAFTDEIDNEAFQAYRESQS